MYANFLSKINYSFVFPRVKNWCSKFRRVEDTEFDIINISDGKIGFILSGVLVNQLKTKLIFSVEKYFFG